MSTYLRVLVVPAVVLALAAVARPAATGPPGRDVVAVVGDPGDLAAVADELGISLVRAASIAEACRRGRAVVVCADSYPTPRLFSRREVAALETFVRSGGRAFVEFARPAAGSILGLRVGQQPKRTMFDRLAIVEPLLPAGQRRAIGAETSAGALLEEHNSAALDIDLAGVASARRIADYGRFIGTYRVLPRPFPPEVWAVTVDLGEPVAVARVRQHFGAGRRDYCPERVRLKLSLDGKTFQTVAEVGKLGKLLGEDVELPAGGRRARWVRIEAEKYRRSDVTDYFFMGEVQVLDDAGHNCAVGRPYRLEAPRRQAANPAYQDDGQKLTDGLPEGLYTDGRSVGWHTRRPWDDRRRPAVVEISAGRGAMVYCATKISDFGRRNFRLARRWRELAREILLWLLDDAARRRVLSRWLPAEVWTWPRVWAAPGEVVEVRARTLPGATVSLRIDGRPGPGAKTAGPDGTAAWQAGRLSRGQHCVELRASLDGRAAVARTVVDIAPRRDKYRRALDRVMAWFLHSGVLPRDDGSAGVWSQRCMAWLDGGPVDTLASPFRCDCNAMSAEAFYRYGMLTGDERWRARAKNIVQTLLAHQYTDATRASFGGFPWLYEHNSTIFFWDDNWRIAQALLHMYAWTGEARYLRAALRTAELFRQVAREDGCVWRHAISRAELDKIGRAAYRQFTQGAGGANIAAMRWYSLAALTGDGRYRDIWDTFSRIYAGRLWLQGLSFVARGAPRRQVREKAAAALKDVVKRMLGNADIARVGALRAGGGPTSYALAFRGDCGIATEPGEPLSDQLYGTGWAMLWAWHAYKAGCRPAKNLAEKIGDYLVRIQFSSSDPRLDGCWMRGFDFENWEYYGAPYDPFYGPYSAYTGWMNAIIARALALYLMDADPFLPQAPHDGAAAVVEQVRAENPPDYVTEQNVALGARYTVEPRPPQGRYGDDGRKLTDGVVDGHWSDGLSVGWHLRPGQRLRVTVTVDLGRPWTIGDITQRYGAMQPNYNPDAAVVLVSLDGRRFVEVGRRRFSRHSLGYLWLRLEPPRQVRYLRFVLTKRRLDDVTDFLFVGETRVFPAAEK